MIVLKYL